MTQTVYGNDNPLDFVLAVSLGIVVLSTYAIFDILAAVSLDFRINLIVGTILLFLAFLLLRYRSWPQRLTLATITLILLVALTQTDWNSRKPFLRDLNRVKAGMGIEEVKSIMDGYMPGARWSDDSSPYYSTTEEDIFNSTLVYRHTDQGWGDSDWGVIFFKDEKVDRVQFFPD